LDNDDDDDDDEDDGVSDDDNSADADCDADTVDNSSGDAEMFISTYLEMISSKVFSGIFSTESKISFKYNAEANLNPPFEIFCCLILPAKSYNPSNRYV
jgi:hypothetical protein